VVPPSPPALKFLLMSAKRFQPSHAFFKFLAPFLSDKLIEWRLTLDPSSGLLLRSRTVRHRHAIEVLPTPLSLSFGFPSVPLPYRICSWVPKIPTPSQAPVSGRFSLFISQLQKQGTQLRPLLFPFSPLMPRSFNNLPVGVPHRFLSRNVPLRHSGVPPPSCLVLRRAEGFHFLSPVSSFHFLFPRKELPHLPGCQLFLTLFLPPHLDTRLASIACLVFRISPPTTNLRSSVFFHGVSFSQVWCRNRLFPQIVRRFGTSGSIS